MMNVIIVGLMNGSPWGGSEELWYGTAKLFAKKGHNVKISIYDWAYNHPKIKELQNELPGIDIHLRPRRAPRLSIFKKFQKGVFKKDFNKIGKKKVWGELELEKADLIIISQEVLLT
jgi:hypothetical protein